MIQLNLKKCAEPSYTGKCDAQHVGKNSPAIASTPDYSSPCSAVDFSRRDTLAIHISLVHGYHLIKNGPFPSKWSPSDNLFATQIRRAIVVVAVSCQLGCLRGKWKSRWISSHLGVEFICLYLGLNSCTGLLSSCQSVFDFGLAVITVLLSVYFFFLTVQVAIRDSQAPPESQT
jgi:hypothetical protein